MSILDEKRLLTKIATLYYTENLKQTDIAKKLNLSQSFVSRSLTKCVAEGIVKINIVPPPNTFLQLEQQIQKKYNISQSIIVDVNPGDSDDKIKSAIGSAAAYYLQVTLQANMLVGVSAWSGTIKAMLDTMPPLNVKAKGVVQLLGGVGINGNVQANFLTYELANKFNCAAYLLPAQSFTRDGNVAYKEQLISEPEVAKVLTLFNQIDLAIVGIGMLEPSQLLKNSGLFYDTEMLALLAEKGAVGDICLHYFDQNGIPVLLPEEDPILGMELSLIKACPRVMALAGGKEKVNAIKGALNGGYIDILVIDKIAAQQLLSD
ncbi:sugar-binding transcriptional regulator [Necropsobacter massiliensis]|uniref:sugar-binding transcriptional regulator n=1 Tax=Necropsobacter massiliensis TaxID=1400001 RepID=UPI000595AC1B|nr:sugar-binding transcriptional regulator [Necropsobacter massiliensis]